MEQNSQDKEGESWQKNILLYTTVNRNFISSMNPDSSEIKKIPFIYIVKRAGKISCERSKSWLSKWSK